MNRKKNKKALSGGALLVAGIFSCAVAHAQAPDTTSSSTAPGNEPERVQNSGSPQALPGYPTRDGWRVVSEKDGQLYVQIDPLYIGHKEVFQQILARLCSGQDDCLVLLVLHQHLLRQPR